jgi:hypothetical protein
VSRELDYFRDELTRMMKRFKIQARFIGPTPSLQIVVWAQMVVTDSVEILDSRVYDCEICVYEREIYFNPESAVIMVMKKFMEDFCCKHIKSFFRPIEQGKHPLILMAEMIEDAARKRGEFL